MTKKRASKPDPIEIFPPQSISYHAPTSTEYLQQAISADESRNRQSTTQRVSDQIAALFDKMGIARPSAVNEDSSEAWRRLAISLAVMYDHINLTVGGTKLGELMTLSEVKSSKLTTDHPDYSIALPKIQDSIYHADFFRIGLDIEREYACSKKEVSTKCWKQFYRLRRFFVTRYGERIIPFLTTCRLGFREIIYLDTVKKARRAANREFKLTSRKDSANDVLVAQLVKGWDSIIHPESYSSMNDIRVQATSFRVNYLAKPDVLNAKRDTLDPSAISIIKVQQAWDMLHIASKAIQPRLEYTVPFIGKVAVYGYCNDITDQELATNFNISIDLAVSWRIRGKELINKKQLNSASVRVMGPNELYSLEYSIGRLLR